jgi:hypothetical protein
LWVLIKIKLPVWRCSNTYAVPLDRQKLQWLGGLRPGPVTPLTWLQNVNGMRQYATAAVVPADAAYAAALLQACAPAVHLLGGCSVHFGAVTNGMQRNRVWRIV